MKIDTAHGLYGHCLSEISVKISSQDFNTNILQNQIVENKQDNRIKAIYNIFQGKSTQGKVTVNN